MTAGQILDASGRPARYEGGQSNRLLTLQDRANALLRDFKHELGPSDRKADLDKAEQERLNSNNWGLGSIAGGTWPGNSYEPLTISGAGTLTLSNAYVPLSLNRILLSYSFMTQGLVRTAVCQRIDDAFRGGFEIKIPELDADETAQLMRDIKRNRGRKELQKIGRTLGGYVNYNACANLARSDFSSMKFLGYWAGLYGGAGLLVNTTQIFSDPLDIEAITEEEPLEFIPADRWELLLSNYNIYDYNKPVPFNYYGYPVHTSRVIKMLVNEAPSFIRQRLQGWGMSELEQCIRAINSYLKFENLMFELIDEAKIDIYKIKGFNTALASAVGTEKIRQRILLGNQLKNFSHGITMDVDDDYQQKTLGSMFGGLADIWEQLRLNLCASLKMPLNKLFGELAGGFGGGQDGLENYNSTVEVVREDLEPAVVEVVELRCQQRYGFIPEELDIGWRPLRVLSGVEEEEVRTGRANNTFGMYDRGLMDGKEASEQLKGDGVLKVETGVLAGTREAVPPMTDVGNDEDGSQAKGGAKQKRQTRENAVLDARRARRVERAHERRLERTRA